jgi:hypothetical protein
MKINLSVRTKKILTTIASSWGILGFNRGIQHYEFNYEESMEEYTTKMKRYNKDIELYNTDIIDYPTITFTKPKLPNKPSNFYITRFTYGCKGFLLYLYPVFIFFYLSKEIYRLEVYLRKM